MKRAIVLLALLAGCAGPPAQLEHARAWAWDQHAYTQQEAFYANVDGDCRGKAAAIAQRLRPLGYQVTYLVGWRTDCPACELHMVPIARLPRGDWYAIDSDRVYPRERFPWRQITLSEVAAAKGGAD